MKTNQNCYNNPHEKRKRFICIYLNNIPVLYGEPGLNSGGMSTSDYIDIVHFYTKPQGYTGQAFD